MDVSLFFMDVFYGRLSHLTVILLWTFPDASVFQDLTAVLAPGSSITRTLCTVGHTTLGALVYLSDLDCLQMKSTHFVGQLLGKW